MKITVLALSYIAQIKKEADLDKRLIDFLEASFLETRGGFADLISKEIDDLIQTMGGPREMLDAWFTVYTKAHDDSMLKVKAKKTILKLALAIEDFIRVYCRLYKFDSLKEDLRSQIRKMAKEEDFPYKMWKHFFTEIDIGDRLEKWIFQGMVRQSKGDIEKGLEVYPLVFHFEDLEKQVRTDIIKNASPIKTKIYVYIRSPLESKLEEGIVADIIQNLPTKEDKFKAYLETPTNSLVKEALFDAIKSDSAYIESRGEMLKWLAYVFSKTREGDKMKAWASDKIKAICVSLGKNAIKILRKLITSFSGTELATWANSRLKELSAIK